MKFIALISILLCGAAAPKATAPDETTLHKMAKENPGKAVCYNWYAVGYFCLTYKGQIKL